MHSGIGHLFGIVQVTICQAILALVVTVEWRTPDVFRHTDCILK